MLFNIATRASWLLLASTAWASPMSLAPRGDKMVLGYRTCSQTEAIALEKKVTRNPAFDNEATQHQLGYGLYTSPKPGEYMSGKGNWVCVIYIDKDFFKDDLAKAWIPEKYKGAQIWERPEDTVMNYVVNDSGVGGDMALSTLRIAIFPHDGKEDLQMMIPTDLVNVLEDELSAKCAATKDGLPTQEAVNYDDWDNVKGHKKDPGNGGGDGSDGSDDSDDDESDDD